MARRVQVGDPNDNRLHHRACICSRCSAAAAIPRALVGDRISAVVGGPVRLAETRQDGTGGQPDDSDVRNGLTLDGATSLVAARCGFRHVDGRCYFTGPKILWLLSRTVAS